MDDMYVTDYCRTRIHCRGYVFTISELFDIAQLHCSDDKLEAHEDNKDES
jgi:hypothetical protein